MQAAPSEHDVGAAPINGAGAMLRKAREAAGISCESLATRTRLELKIIHALENEDYGSLAAAAFIKGYIRSLSKELKIDPTPILNQYGHAEAADDPRLADFTTRSPAQLTSSSTLMRGVSIALVFAVIILIALWWQRNYQTDADSAEAIAQLADEAALEVAPDPGIPLSYPYTIVDHSTDPLAPANSWRRQTDGSAPPLIGAVVDDTNIAATADVTDGAPPNERSAPAAPPPVSTTGDLVLVGDGESWIEISDFAGRRLYFGLIKPGQQIGVGGKPPYDLVIGNAQVVKLTYLGQPIDVRARAINGVARFSLGELN